MTPHSLISSLTQCKYPPFHLSHGTSVLKPLLALHLCLVPRSPFLVIFTLSSHSQDSLHFTFTLAVLRGASSDSPDPLGVGSGSPDPLVVAPSHPTLRSRALAHPTLWSRAPSHPTLRSWALARPTLWSQPHLAQPLGCSVH